MMNYYRDDLEPHYDPISPDPQYHKTPLPTDPKNRFWSFFDKESQSWDFEKVFKIRNTVKCTKCGDGTKCEYMTRRDIGNYDMASCRQYNHILAWNDLENNKKTLK